MVSEEEIEKAKKDVARFCTEWRKRKRGCMDIVDMISESMDMNRKEFFKKVGSIETDEDCGVNIVDYQNL